MIFVRKDLKKVIKCLDVKTVIGTAVKIAHSKKETLKEVDFNFKGVIPNNQELMIFFKIYSINDNFKNFKLRN